MKYWEILQKLDAAGYEKTMPKIILANKDIQDTACINMTLGNQGAAIELEIMGIENFYYFSNVQQAIDFMIHEANVLKSQGYK